LSKLKALVRAATADPQASGHAKIGACPAGARRKLPLTIFSNAGAIRSTEDPDSSTLARPGQTIRSSKSKRRGWNRAFLIYIQHSNFNGENVTNFA